MTILEEARMLNYFVAQIDSINVALDEMERLTGDDCKAEVIRMRKGTNQMLFFLQQFSASL